MAAFLYLASEMVPLSEKFKDVILTATGASSLEVEGSIQELWSGYGQILRVLLDGKETVGAIVVKHVTMPTDSTHPRGWNSDLSHQRKIYSYQVESEWYRSWSQRCDDQCRIPKFLDFARDGEHVLLILEDMDAAGYPGRMASVSKNEMSLCLKWLAEFHATFLGEKPVGLWEKGTYWHLETRPEELEKLEDYELKAAAHLLDRILGEARYQTIVHGDAKLANFCFSKDADRVSALDFQYVGGGCGMKDVAYFIGSCLDESSCEEQEAFLLDTYFNFLTDALQRRKPGVNAAKVAEEWRTLFPIAWTDFHRFLKGWCPGHRKINTYSERVARDVIANLSKFTE